MFEYSKDKTYFVDKIKHQNEEFKVLHKILRMKYHRPFYVVFLGDGEGKPICTTNDRYWAVPISQDRKPAKKIKVGDTISWHVEQVNKRLGFVFKIGSSENKV